MVRTICLILVYVWPAKFYYRNVVKSQRISYKNKLSTLYTLAHTLWGLPLFLLSIFFLLFSPLFFHVASLSSPLSFGQQFFFRLPLVCCFSISFWVAKFSFFFFYYFPLLFTCSVGWSKWRHWAALPFYRHTKRTINPSYIKIRDERGQSVSMCGCWRMRYIQIHFPQKAFYLFPVVQCTHV